MQKNDVGIGQVQILRLTYGTPMTCQYRNQKLCLLSKLASLKLKYSAKQASLVSLEPHQACLSQFTALNGIYGAWGEMKKMMKCSRALFPLTL